MTTLPEAVRSAPTIDYVQLNLKPTEAPNVRFLIRLIKLPNTALMLKLEIDDEAEFTFLSSGPVTRDHLVAFFVHNIRQTVGAQFLPMTVVDHAIGKISKAVRFLVEDYWEGE